MKKVTFKDLKGKTFKDIQISSDKEEMEFIVSDDDIYVMHHDQCCCEYVSIEDVCGDINDIIGSPILDSEEIIYQEENPKEVEIPRCQDNSFTWTFYKLSTIKGSITIRWYGESNGYYSESVDMYRTKTKRTKKKT